MKEQIYTIPVMDAFKEESECPLCILESNLENYYIDYVLGPSLMEPACRIETNEKGFCRRHFELLFNKQENRLGLGLIIDTHLFELNKTLKKMYNKLSKIKPYKNKRELQITTELQNSKKNIFGRSPSYKQSMYNFVDELIKELTEIENQCMVCDRINYTMDRYIEVILHLWCKEEEFRNLFCAKNGFCLKHLRLLLEGTKKYLDSNNIYNFVEILLKMEVENMERIKNEVSWFTEKFDYRNVDAPWGNSKDSIQRSIQKIVGPCNFK